VVQRGGEGGKNICLDNFLFDKLKKLSLRHTLSMAYSRYKFWFSNILTSCGCLVRFLYIKMKYIKYRQNFVIFTLIGFLNVVTVVFVCATAKL
jgi:hypothetical protein